MIEEKAVIESCDEHWLQVRVSGEEACETCDLAEQCYRDGGLLKIARSHLRGPLAETPETITPGRTIKLTMENTSLLGLTGVVYGLPLLLFAFGLGIGFYWLFPDAGEAGRALGSFAAGLLLVAVAWLPIVRLDRRMAQRVRYRIELPEDQDDSAESYYLRQYSHGE